MLRNLRFSLTIQTNINLYMFQPQVLVKKKNTFSTTAGFLIFSGESLSRSNRSLDKRFDLRFDLPCDRSLHPVSHAHGHVTNCCD